MSQRNDRLRNAREQRGWTQQYVAGKVGTDTYTVGRWERGVQPPSGHFRHRLCQLFTMSATELGLSVEEAIADTTSQISSTLWHVPYKHNPCFTDRKGLVSFLRERLTEEGKDAPHWAISGLGGIGKTQLALAYAYEYRNAYRAVFWVNASTQTQLLGGLAQIASIVQVPEAKKSEPRQQYLVNEALHWMQTHHDWLLILDNVEESLDTEDPDNVEKDVALDRLLLMLQTAHILLTTRSQTVARLAQNLLLEEMQPEEGAQLLLLRPLQPSSSEILHAASAPDREAACTLSRLLGGLPLALEQARAYIHATGCGFDGYKLLYEECRQQLLREMVKNTQLEREYQESVATTWVISFRRVEQQFAPAADMLKLYAYLAPDTIPEDIVLRGANKLDGELRQLTGDLFHFNQACQVLLNYSLIKRNAQEAVVSIHRLVQAVLQDRMAIQERHFWAEQAVRTVEHVFSEALSTEQDTERYLPHARVCATLIKKLELQGEAAAHLLEITANAVYKSGWYAQANPLYLRALRVFSDLQEDNASHIISLLLRIADVHMKLGIYPLAAHVYKNVKERIKQCFGSDHPDVVLCLNDMAMAQKEIEAFSALQTCKQSLDWHHRRISTTDPTLRAMTYFVAGEVYARLSMNESAEAYHRAALQMREQLLGFEHPARAESLAALGVFYLQRQRVVEAEPLLHQALEIRQKVLGIDHPDTADCLVYLGMLFWDQGNYVQAEARYTQALDIRRRKLGFYHPGVAEILHDLAEISAEQKKDEDAERYFREALNIAPKAVGSETVEYLLYLQAFEGFLRARDRSDEAEIYDQHITDLVKRLKKRGPLGISTVQNADGNVSAAYMWFLRCDDETA